jgi:hypothetical protein
MSGAMDEKLSSGSDVRQDYTKCRIEKDGSSRDFKKSRDRQNKCKDCPF